MGRRDNSTPLPALRDGLRSHGSGMQGEPTNPVDGWLTRGTPEACDNRPEVMANSAVSLDSLYIRAYIQQVPDEDDESFERLLDDYLDRPVERNPDLLDVEIVWVENDPGLGARHIWEQHQVSKEEVEEVLFEIPPVVEARRSKGHPERTIFWGATRHDRWLFVSCEDRTVGRKRYLKPITAFEPAEGEAYWRRQ